MKRCKFCGRPVAYKCDDYCQDCKAFIFFKIKLEKIGALDVDEPVNPYEYIDRY